MTTATTKSTCYDNTRISTYKVCPRSYLLRHVLGWTKGTGKSMALSFGSSWHDAQDIVWGHAKKFGQEDLRELAFLAFTQTWEAEGLEVYPSLEKLDFYGARTPQIAREMLDGYIKVRWPILQEAEVFAVETPFAVPLPGLDDHWYIGRLDKGINFKRQRLVVEHKTTTAYSIALKFLPDFTEQWAVSAQVKGYQFGATLYYGELDGVWVDAALVHKKVHDGFKFIPVNHGTAIMTEWVQSTVGWAHQITEETKEFERCGELKPGMFKKNEESCYGKYGPCQFIDICRSIADPSKLDEPPAGFSVDRWEPFSVLGLDKIVQGDKK